MISRERRIQPMSVSCMTVVFHTKFLMTSHRNVRQDLLKHSSLLLCLFVKGTGEKFLFQIGCSWSEKRRFSGRFLIRNTYDWVTNLLSRLNLSITWFPRLSLSIFGLMTTELLTRQRCPLFVVVPTYFHFFRKITIQFCFHFSEKVTVVSTFRYHRTVITTSKRIFWVLSFVMILIGLLQRICNMNWIHRLSRVYRFIE